MGIKEFSIYRSVVMGVNGRMVVAMGSEGGGNYGERGKKWWKLWGRRVAVAMVEVDGDAR